MPAFRLRTTSLPARPSQEGEAYGPCDRTSATCALPSSRCPFGRIIGSVRLRSSFRLQQPPRRFPLGNLGLTLSGLTFLPLLKDSPPDFTGHPVLCSPPMDSRRSNLCPYYSTRRAPCQHSNPFRLCRSAMRRLQISRNLSAVWAFLASREGSTLTSGAARRTTLFYPGRPGTFAGCTRLWSLISYRAGVRKAAPPFLPSPLRFHQREWPSRPSARGLLAHQSQQTGYLMKPTQFQSRGP
jgi:hypothetical protein